VRTGLAVIVKQSFSAHLYYSYHHSCPRFRSYRLHHLLATILLGIPILLSFTGCNRRGERVREVVYVSAPQAVLRDQVAAIYNRVGFVKNGERLEVLEHDRRFARVRTASGIEGWIEQRFLVDQKIYDGLQKLTEDNQNDPVQAPGVLRNDTNMHIAPGRETEHLYQLSSGARVSLLKRATAEKEPGLAVATPRPGGKAPPAPALEDWWLVRDAQGRVGWVLARMVDVDVPLDIAEYAEGQRFVAFFMLDQVRDGPIEKTTTKNKKGAPESQETLSSAGSADAAVAGTSSAGTEQAGAPKLVPQYLCVLTEPHDGLPYDYDQIRVFTWNVRKHRYETAYREHGLNGFLPVTVTKEDFGKEGMLPVFILRVKDDAGNISERKYKLNTPIVRRVLAPGEVPEKVEAKHRRR